jgi:flagellar protein FlgJ
MDSSGPASGIASTANALAVDSRSLEQLKRAARDDPRQAVKKVATQFEAMFMQMVLKSMREATTRSGLLDSQEQDMYRGMLDQQVAQQIAAGGTGLADVIARQLSRNLPTTANGAAPPGAPGAGAQAPAATRAAAPATGIASLAAAPAAGPATATAPSSAQHDFMQQHWTDAVRAQQLTGVPASFILGQAALESGWGSREIRGPDGQPSYNLFGIKAGPGWQGKTVQVTTTEYDGAAPRKTVQSFRAYDSYAAAFQDWATTIGRNQRYSAAVAAGGSAGGFAFGMQQAGYSTDPAYGEKLARVIRTASSIGGTG